MEGWEKSLSLRGRWVSVKEKGEVKEDEETGGFADEFQRAQ